MATAVPGSPAAQWVGAWAAAPTAAGGGSSKDGFTDQSVRMTVRASVGGDAVRIRVSDAFGDRPLTVGHATVALPDPATPERSDVKAGSVRELSFSGNASIVVPKGAQVLSDPVPFKVSALQELVVTLYLPIATGPSTWHWTSNSTTFVGAGDQAATPAGAGFTVTRASWYFLTGVDVQGRFGIGSFAILGDSLTDGNASTLDANRRWPDRLAERLVADHPFGPFQIGVLNLGLAGNEVLHDGSEISFNELGVNGLARLNRDAFAQSGVKVVAFCLSINDIHIFGEPAANLITGLKQAAAQIREQGLIPIGCTVTPFEGFSSWTPGKETIRQAVNAYVRDNHDFAGVLDFDRVLRDPAAPTKIRAEWDSGDHIHPTDAGYRAMADSIPLGLVH